VSSKAIARTIGCRLDRNQAGTHRRIFAWIEPLVEDLQQHNGASIVLAGENQPPIIHALAHAMNNALGNVGKTVFYTDPLEVNPVDHEQSLQDSSTTSMRAR
jgi:molybdopterin-containing oxidoreductase family iron-sulfur binding subunit